MIIDFKIKVVTRDKDGQLIIIKGIIYQGDKIFINI